MYIACASFCVIGVGLGYEAVDRFTRIHTQNSNLNTHRVLVEGKDAEVDVVARERAGQDVERDGDALVLFLYLFF